MKKILLFCLLLFAQRVSAQNINIDSLIRLAMVKIENDPLTLQPNRDSLFNVLTHTSIAREKIALIYKIINSGQGSSREGLIYHYRILTWAKKNNDRLSEAIISAELGFETAVNGDIAEGESMAQRALIAAKKTKNNEAIGIAYDNLGCCYSTDEADKISVQIGANYFKEGVKFSLAGNNDLFVAYNLGGAGSCFNILGKTDSALYYTLKSLEYAVRKNVAIQIANSLLDLGNEQKSDALKLKYFRAGLKIASKKSYGTVLARTAVYLSNYYKAQGRQDSAFYYARLAYRSVYKKPAVDQILPTMLMASLYTGHNSDSALKYTKIYYAARDSMYSIAKAQRAQAMVFAEAQRKQDETAKQAAYENRLRYYVFGVAILFLVVLIVVLSRNNTKQKKTNWQLQEQKEEITSQRNALDKAFNDLKITQNQLIQSEKMASLGELTAGIAHEIQNPLNFVNNFSEVNHEMIDELKLELKNGNINEALLIADDIQQNEEKITHHGKRADGIVKGMLQHSRASSGTKEPTNLNALADEYLRLAYHGLRAKDKSFNAELITNFDESLPKVNVVPQDIGRVMLNLFTNAFYAVQQKQKTAGPEYKPTITVTTSLPPSGGRGAVLSVTDNGTGIPAEIKDKILQPFFTTKPTGEGTGLGLSLSYDIIVKGHGGSIDVESKGGEGSEFIVKLPLT